MAHIPRIHVAGHIAPGQLTIAGEPAKRLGAVMRVREGDALLVFSGDGHEWQAVVGSVGRGEVRVEVGALARMEPLPALTVELWCALVRPNRFDWMVEKVTEAGADIIRPLLCDFSARGEGASTGRKERWERITVEASEQSGRLHLPVVAEPVRFVDQLAKLHAPLLFAHLEVARNWAETEPLLPRTGALVIAIGPEGGFSPAEVAAAKAHGALVTALGPHILRTETAALAAVVLVRAL